MGNWPFKYTILSKFVGKKSCHIIMMWEFEVNPKRNEEIGIKNTNFSKKFKGA
jgi:hypothetical protein